MKYLIATTARPVDFPEFFQTLREILTEEEPEASIPAILFTRGPGCYNLAFEIAGSANPERWAEMFAIALMPAKVCQTTDKLPDVDTVDI